VARLAESLQAHIWPELTMKTRDPTTIQSKPPDPTTRQSKPPDTGVTTVDSLSELESKATASSASKQDSNKRLGELAS